VYLILHQAIGTTRTNWFILQRSQTRCQIGQVGWFMELGFRPMLIWISPQPPKPTHTPSRKNNEILILQPGFPFLVDRLFNPFFCPVPVWSLI